MKSSMNQSPLSTQALVFAVVWSGVVVVLRVFIIDKAVPFLSSKHVFKRLGAIIDIDTKIIQFKRFPQKQEPLYDIESGHVAIELVKRGSTPRTVDPSGIELCVKGDEVTVADPVLHNRLNACSPSHGIHKVSYEPLRPDETDHGYEACDVYVEHTSGDDTTCTADGAADVFNFWISQARSGSAVLQ